MMSLAKGEQRPGKPENHRLQLGVLISGSGRTMLNLADEIDRGELDAEIAVVISSRADVAGVERARERGLPTYVVPRKEYKSDEAFSEAVWLLLDHYDVELACLAGFLSLLRIPKRFAGRVINIHPALLPDYGGKGMYGRRVHEAVLAAGEKESGCTVHFADEEYDRGQIILQRRCEVRPDDTPETLAARVHEEELKAYPEAIRMILRGEAREGK